MDKSKLLDRAAAAGEDRLVLARILESTMENGNRTIMESEMFLSGTKF